MTQESGCLEVDSKGIDQIRDFKDKGKCYTCGIIVKGHTFEELKRCFDVFAEVCITELDRRNIQ